MFAKFLIARKIFSTCPQIRKISSFLWTKVGYIKVYPFDSNETFHKVYLSTFGYISIFGLEERLQFIKESAKNLFAKFLERSGIFFHFVHKLERFFPFCGYREGMSKYALLTQMESSTEFILVYLSITRLGRAYFNIWTQEKLEVYRRNL